MTEPTPSNGKSNSAASAASNLIDLAMQAVNGADEAAARQRSRELRTAHPDATNERLVELLIQKKCMQTGMVGAVTSGAAIFPGLGTLATVTAGTLADISMCLKMQAELVLEIAEVYGRSFDSPEKRNVLLLVTGASVGVEELLTLGGKRVAQKASQRFTQRTVLKAIPILGIGATAGANMLSTYVIGKRANAYFQLGSEAVGNWGDSLRAISGVDERRLVAWSAELLSQRTSGARTRAKEGIEHTGRLLGKMGTSMRRLTSRNQK